MAISLLLLLLFATFFISCSFSQIILPLTHFLSKTQFKTTHHLLKSTSTLSAAKLRHRHHSRRQVSLPLSPGSDYTLTLSLGSNVPQQITLYMDTGSDLIWFPCSPFECILCEGKTDPKTAAAAVFNVSSTAAALVSCKSPSCAAAHSTLSSSDLCAMAKCSLENIEISDCSSHSCPQFYYAYADGSLIGRLYRDDLSIATSTPGIVVKNFTFGCAHSALGEPIGVAGFGRGVLSLPGQLATFSPELGNQFSYCLVSHSFDSDRVRRPSPLILGRHLLEETKENELNTNKGDGFLFTSMLDNPRHPYFYSVGLEGISIGQSWIQAPASMKRVDREGNGGVVVDSGTTYTMLPARFFHSVTTEFNRQVGRFYKRASETEDRTGLGPCFYIDPVGTESRKVPSLVLHFVGKNSSVVLPRNNYFYEFIDGGDGAKKGKKVGCLMMMNGGDEAEASGPAATLGNYQQQGFEVVYDLEKHRVGFARRKCSSLWDTMNRR